jgi:hypothetical protein
MGVYLIFWNLRFYMGDLHKMCVFLKKATVVYLDMGIAYNLFQNWIT